MTYGAPVYVSILTG